MGVLRNIYFFVSERTRQREGENFGEGKFIKERETGAVHTRGDTWEMTERRRDRQDRAETRSSKDTIPALIWVSASIRHLFDKRHLRILEDPVASVA